MPRPGEPAQLYLVISEGLALAIGPQLGEVLTKHAVPVVLITPGTGSGTANLTTLVNRIQSMSIAVLIENDASLAKATGADGVHIGPSKTADASFAGARTVLGPRALIGVDAGRSRHDAMALGEAGSEYVGFGIPTFVEDRESARHRRLELIEWWSEIFEIPCVAFDVETPDDAAQLAAAGADFIAVAPLSTVAPGSVDAFLAHFSAAVRAPAPAA